MKNITASEQSIKILDFLDWLRLHVKLLNEDKLKEEFKKLYGNREIELPSHIITINDSYTSPFSTWTNGYLTKVRLNNDNFEFYHDWWIYGWISFDKVKEKYPCAACKIEFLINYLIK